MLLAKCLNLVIYGLGLVISTLYFPMTNLERDATYDVVWNGQRGPANLDLLSGGLDAPARFARTAAAVRRRDVLVDRRPDEDAVLAALSETPWCARSLREIAHALDCTPDRAWPPLTLLLQAGRVARVEIERAIPAVGYQGGRPATYGYRLVAGAC